MVCTVKPVTHYANNDSPNLSSTAYTEIDAEYLKSQPFENKEKDIAKEKKSDLNYADVEFIYGHKEEESSYDKGTSGNHKLFDDKGTAQNYAELDFSRR